MAKQQDVRLSHAPVDWQALVLDTNGHGLKMIERLATRRFNQGPLAEEASTFVLDRLSEDNWRRCHRFKGNAKPTTFLQTLIVNLLEEFSRQRFGRPRPPTWLQRQGELWVKLWKELCLERQSLSTLVHRYTQASLYDHHWINHVAKTIKARIPKCGEYRFEADNVKDIASIGDQQQIENHETPSELCGFNFELNAESELLLVLQAIIQEQPSESDFSDQRITQIKRLADDNANRLNKLREALVLSDEELIVLRMTYCDGLSKSAVSRALGLPSHRAGLMIRDIFKRIHQAVTTCGIDLHSLLTKI